MAIDTDALGGTAYLTMDGLGLPVVSGTGYGVATVKREAMMGMDGFHGWKLTPIPGFIKATVRNILGISTEDYTNLAGVSVSLELTNGKRATGNDMACVEAVAVEGDEQTIELRFEGPKVTEV
ncbi:phage tail tube protein [Pararoseomonas indoligenes]|uniref:Phage tail tube protein n=1 Tax=Roseomonas indoligenes TaxID=2820811 RepID=A0A940MWB8_9PROT|nr:phage tail tube protein [Pararoseomonas indoligenes]MBP0492878.1 phage tail tube protein [Pararoseomonas indoligenes]